MTLPSIQIWGLDITDYVDKPGSTSSGNSLKLSEYASAFSDFASLNYEGRNQKKAALNLSTRLDRTTLEEIISEINNAPEGSEFYPFDAERCALIFKASAGPIKSHPVINPGSSPLVNANTFEAEASISTINGLLYGPDQILYSGLSPSLPKTLAFTNAGTYQSGLDWLYVQGYYDIATYKYITGLYISIENDSIKLLDFMNDYDKLFMDRLGHITHQYSTDFGVVYGSLQNDLRGPTYVDYGASGTIAYESFYMSNSATLLVPFAGPLKCYSNPFIEIDVTSLAGSPLATFAFSSDLSDIDYLSTTIKTGYNKIYFPDCQGEDEFYLGITTDASSSLTISSFSAEVRRDVSLSEMPTIDPDESSSIVIGVDEWSNPKARDLEVIYRDAYWG